MANRRIIFLLTATGMTQQEFADYFKIPKRTIESWVSKSNKNSRECPEYVVDLIEYKLRKEKVFE